MTPDPSPIVVDLNPPVVPVQVHADPVALALDRLAAVDVSFPEQLGTPGLAKELRYASAPLGDWKTLRDVLPIALQLARRTHAAELELRAMRRRFSRHLEDVAASTTKAKGPADA